jgi:hypothetical protein
MAARLKRKKLEKRLVRLYSRLRTPVAVRSRVAAAFGGHAPQDRKR